ncbi:hypothetical protein GJ496_010461 [Pomphorhynchus laevis]|nr:hypothetical protein GJ496_010461 [Pomphorhynchus laevis]
MSLCKVLPCLYFSNGVRHKSVAARVSMRCINATLGGTNNLLLYYRDGKTVCISTVKCSLQLIPKSTSTTNFSVFSLMISPPLNVIRLETHR